VIPAFNEQESLPFLLSALEDTSRSTRVNDIEILVIDDGSTDGTWKAINELSTTRENITIRAFRFRRNFGKAAALDLGFKLATGDIIITMDADLQDDPAEISHLIMKLGEGWDLVTGWKKTRQDPLSKTLPSRLFNAVTSFVTGLRLHDFNCGLKAYRREVVQNLRIYGELHRFIPALAHAQGFRVTEIPVKHHPRKYGVSKYGWRRFMRGFLDLLTVVATTKYLARPAHLFGGLGVIFGAVGLAALFYLSMLWFLGQGPIGDRPLLLFGVLCVLVSVQFVSIGLLAELFNSKSPQPDPEWMVSESIESARNKAQP
jgi:dolichol-phosphate mannosyltransferase